MIEIHRKIVNLNNPTAVALGYFDGVHLGHQKVLRSAVEMVNSHLVPVVFSFSSNPKCFLKNKNEKCIVSVNKKIEIFEKIGIKVAFFIEFETIYKLSPQEFVENILIKKLKAQFLCCGFNYRFGKNSSGNIKTLQMLCDFHKTKLKITQPVVQNDEIISSTRIRELIVQKNFKLANDMLGRNEF